MNTYRCLLESLTAHVHTDKVRRIRCTVPVLHVYIMTKLTNNKPV